MCFSSLLLPHSSFPELFLIDQLMAQSPSAVEMRLNFDSTPLARKGLRADFERASETSRARGRGKGGAKLNRQGSGQGDSDSMDGAASPQSLSSFGTNTSQTGSPEPEGFISKPHRKATRSSKDD